jgi:hypothetical protein
MPKDLKFFTETSDILALASVKFDGNMKGESLFDGVKNRSNFLNNRLSYGAKIIMAGIEHNNQVKEVDRYCKEEIIKGVDGLVTQDNNIFLGVTFADCPFILLSGMNFSKKQRVVGAAHCGYRGTVKNIAGEMIAKMEEKKAEAKYVKAVIGPGICEKCFEFGSDAPEIFSKYAEFLRSQNGTGKFLVDLKGIIKKQLIQSGVLENNIYVSDLCTFEDESLFSFRREKMDPNNIKAGIALIGIKKLQEKKVFSKKFPKLRAAHAM